MSSRKRSGSSPLSPPLPKRSAFGSPSTPFSPSSSSSSSRFVWLDRLGTRQSVLHAKYDEPVASTKVAGFDFLGTLIEPVSQGRYPQGPQDWKWLKKKGEGPNETPKVVLKLRELYEQGYGIVIFSSTSLLVDESFETFRQVVEAACMDLDVPLHAFFSTGYDVYRKPCVGMWKEFEQDWNCGEQIELKESFFVSHASAVGKLDYGRKFAMNLSVRFFSPRDYFWEEPDDATYSFRGFNPKKYDHSAIPVFMPTSTPLVPRKLSEFDDEVADVVFLVGPPASGKTSLYNRVFAKPLPTWPQSLASSRRRIRNNSTSSTCLYRIVRRVLRTSNCSTLSPPPPLRSVLGSSSGV